MTDHKIELLKVEYPPCMHLIYVLLVHKVLEVIYDPKIGQSR